MKDSDFREDLKFIYLQLQQKKHFAFSKYADGEYAILRNQPIQNCDGWIFDPSIHSKEHELLLESFKFEHPQYYKGISCPCCRPQEEIKWMRENAGGGFITWANLFVNSNYPYFNTYFFEEFNKWEGKVILFANKQGIDQSLPFDIDYYYPLDLDSWLNPKLDKILIQAKDMALIEDNQLYLFSAGPLGNMLAYELLKMNPNNTYIDIGSTINPWTVGKNRGYFNNPNPKTCIW